MAKLNVIFNKDNRSIDVSYKIESKKTDEALFYAITDIVRKNKLDCNFGEDSKHLRFFHIYGMHIEDVNAAYEVIEKLNN